jgi:hypothetical protein
VSCQAEEMDLDQRSVRKTFNYRLMPTPEQQRAMERVLWRCRELCNAGLEERKAVWEQCGVTASFAMQSGQLPAIREVRPD